MTHHNTEIYRFDKVRWKLVDLLDSDKILFDEVRNLSQSKLAKGYSNIQDASQYFEELQNTFDEGDLLEFLINLTEYMSLHIEHGTEKVSNLLQDCLTELETRKIDLQEKGIWSDENFVGREKEMDDITEWIQDLNSQQKGLSLCGMGGMGKTSLANQICLRIWNNASPWIPLKVNMREQKSLANMIDNTLACLNEKYALPKTEEVNPSQMDNEVSEKQIRFLINKICGIKKRTLLLFDNIDDILQSESKELLSFLLKLLQGLPKKNCKVKVIVTSRQKLLEDVDESLRYLVISLPDFMREEEVRQLTKEHAEVLFDKCTKKMKETDYHVSNTERNTILECCGYCPLAIRSVCSSLQTGFVTVQSMILNLTSVEKDSLVTHVLRVSNCLQQSFEKLDTISQRKLMQLSLYKTSEFEVCDAVALWGDGGSNSKQSCVKATLDLVYLKSRHFVEISDFRFQTEEMDVSETSRGKTKWNKYSIHPLVHTFLKSHEDLFNSEMVWAKERFIDHTDECILRHSKKMYKDGGHGTPNPALMSRVQLFLELLHSMKHKIPELQRKETTHDMTLKDIIYKYISENHTKHDFYTALIENTTVILKKIYWLTQKANLYFEMDRTIDCQNALLEAEALIGQMGNDTNVKEHNPIMARYYFVKSRLANRYNKACHECFPFIDRAIDLLRDRRVHERHKDSLALTYNLKGCIYFKNNMFENALRLHKEALNLVQDSGYLSADTKVYMANVATCYYSLGAEARRSDSSAEAGKAHLETAERYYKTAMELETTKTEDRATKMTNLGKLYITMEKYDKAQEMFEESLRVKEEVLTPPHRSLTIALHDLGDLMRRRGAVFAKEGNNKEHRTCSAEGVKYYERIMEMARIGGLKPSDEFYRDIVFNHKQMLKRSCKRKKIEGMKRFYADLESGKFERKARKMSGIEETMKKSAERSRGISYDISSSDDTESSSASSSSPVSNAMSLPLDETGSEGRSSDESDTVNDINEREETGPQKNLERSDISLPVQNEPMTIKYDTQQSKDSGVGTSLNSLGGSQGSTSASFDDTRMGSNSKLHSMESASSFEEVFSPPNLSSRKSSLFSSQDSSLDDGTLYSFSEMTGNRGKKLKRKRELKRQYSVEDTTPLDKQQSKENPESKKEENGAEKKLKM